jgi:hypothetical protein
MEPKEEGQFGIKKFKFLNIRIQIYLEIDKLFSYLKYFGFFSSVAISKNGIFKFIETVTNESGQLGLHTTGQGGKFAGIFLFESFCRRIFGRIDRCKTNQYST